MDLGAILFVLAIGSFIFGLLLVVFKFNKKNPQNVPFWIPAKFLQAAGSFMLSFRTEVFDGIAVLANIAILTGCAYEAWAIRTLSGKSVKRWIHILTSVTVIFICMVMGALIVPYRIGVVFMLQSSLYFLPSIFLFQNSNLRSLLRMILAVCYSLAASVFLISGLISLIFPEKTFHLERNPVLDMFPLVSFCIFLISSYILLMLAKERSDMQVREIRKNLQRSEIRFRQIVETANEGILIFDKYNKITFANKNMASILGYTVDEMIGSSYISYFPESQLGVYYDQMNLRKKGKDSVYECCLQRKDGRNHWFLVSAKAMLDESGRFEGSFAMLTDINERKEMELLLEESNRQLQELSNKDPLTGIANRRYFDAVLEHEYSRLRRSNSQLSIILIDVDHFKEYNDFYGHVMGDECLRQVGKVLASSISRSVDLAARYGGEEFACILPDTNIYGAVKIAEKIRQGIQELKIEHKKSSVSDYVTASIGVTTVQYSPDYTLADIIDMADKLLYKAKISGRNRIEYAEAEAIGK